MKREDIHGEVWAMRLIRSRIHNACFWAQLEGQLEEPLAVYSDLVHRMRDANADQIESIRQYALAYQEKRMTSVDLITHTYSLFLPELFDLKTTAH